MEIYRCESGGHEWGTQDEAERCCNGWVWVMAPAAYGKRERARGLPVRREEWYIPGLLWKPVLIPEDDTAEVERLLRLRRDDVVCPMGLFASPA